MQDQQEWITTGPGKEKQEQLGISKDTQKGSRMFLECRVLKVSEESDYCLENCYLKWNRMNFMENEVKRIFSRTQSIFLGISICSPWLLREDQATGAAGALARRKQHTRLLPLTGHCGWRAGPNVPWPPKHERWPYPSPWAWENWPSRHGCRRTGFAPHLRGADPAAWTDYLSYRLGPHSGPWVGPPCHLPHLQSAGTCEGTGPVEWYLQDLHYSAWLRNVQEKFWWGSNDDGVSEVSGLELGQWLIAMNIFK